MKKVFILVEKNKNNHTSVFFTLGGLSKVAVNVKKNYLYRYDWVNDFENEEYSIKLRYASIPKRAKRG